MPMIRRTFVALLLFGLVAGMVSTMATAADVTVFAAASLKEAMDDQARQFEASTGNKVIVSYGASNALAKQVEAAAPADIFISATSTGWTTSVSANCLRPTPGSIFCETRLS